MVYIIRYNGQYKILVLVYYYDIETTHSRMHYIKKEPFKGDSQNTHDANLFEVSVVVVFL